MPKMENKESFQKRLQPFFSPSGQLDIKLAYVLAKFGHRAQVRKELDVEGNPTRYFEHVRRVAIILMDELHIMDKNMIIAALLHDCFEDTEDITPELIEHSFGTDVVNIVKILSKVPKEGYHERLAHCCSWRVIAIKACDRLDNLRSLMTPGTTIEFQKKQIKETKEIYYPIIDDVCRWHVPQEYKVGFQWVRDEIRRLVERYTVMLEIQGQNV
jgi:(p)ppGpp synthase/HD superfamily hydrolase